MTPSAPKKWTFYLGLVLWVLGLLAPWLPGLQGVEVLGGLTSGYVLAIFGGLVLIIGTALDNF